jgi:hypothetical protein
MHTKARIVHSNAREDDCRQLAAACAKSLQSTLILCAGHWTKDVRTRRLVMTSKIHKPRGSALPLSATSHFHFKLGSPNVDSN